MMRKLTPEQKETVRRILKKKRRLAELKEQRLFPQIWDMPLNEETFLALVANYFPLHISLSKMLKKLSKAHLKKDLLLSSAYLHNFRRIHPYYYSDRERLIVFCNRYIQSHNPDVLGECLGIPAFSDCNLTYMLKGIIDLNDYLFNLKNREKLLQAKLIFNSLEEDMGNEGKVILAFIHYLEGEFDRSFEVLQAGKGNLKAA